MIVCNLSESEYLGCLLTYFCPHCLTPPPRVSVLRAALSGHPVSAWIDRALYICKSHSFPFQSVIDNLWSVLIDTGMSLYAPDCVYLLSVYRRIKLKRRDKAPEVIGKRKHSPVSPAGFVSGYPPLNWKAPFTPQMSEEALGKGEGNADWTSCLHPSYI